MPAIGPGAGGGILDEVVSFFRSLPPVTRFLFTGTGLVSLAAGLGIVSPMQMIFIPKLAFNKLQLWRLVTPFLFNSLSIDLLMHLYFLYRTSHDLETGFFVGKPADYVFFMTWCFGLITLGAWYFRLVVMARPLLMAMTYVWSQNNGEQLVSFLFGIQFKARYLPWALIGLDMVQGQIPPTPQLIGLAVGYVYYYLDRTYPAQHNGQRLLYTPQILQDWYPPQGGQGGTAAAGYRYVPPARPQPAGPATGGRRPAEDTTSARRHAWGTGRRLGE
ncbi:Derlin 1 [Gaertneriomyces sp. JEL0708]|nr:Derlin 1 [Gaertneriomyces sp. JEL0708]